MEIFIGAGLFVAAVVVYGLYSRIEKLEREVKALRDSSARSLHLISELHARPDVECELAREARKHRRDMAKLGIFSEH